VQDGGDDKWRPFVTPTRKERRKRRGEIGERSKVDLPYTERVEEMGRRSVVVGRRGEAKKLRAEVYSTTIWQARLQVGLGARC